MVQGKRKVRYHVHVGRIFLFIILPLAGIIAGVGAGFFFLTGSAKAKAIGQIREEVTVSYGTPITLDIFLSEGADASTCEIVSDISQINPCDLATYQITLMTKGYKVKSILNVVDNIAPTAQVVPQRIYCNQLPDPNDCVENVYDKSEVTVTYAEGTDVSVGGDIMVGIELTDAYCNKVVLMCPFTVIDDHTGPVIEGCEDIDVMVGELPSYREGVTVTDDYDPHPRLTIDNSQVDFDTPGSYPLKYIAIDECGNQTMVTVSVIVNEVPEEEEEAAAAGGGGGSGIRYNRASNTAYDNCTVDDAYAAARKIYNSICKASDSDVLQGLKIFYWVNHNISFSLHGTTTVSWAAAACQAFGRRYSSCYGEWAACKALCDVAGIPNRQVGRLTGKHTWCLCYLNGGWYHCDATQYPGAGHRFSYMMTDAEIARAVGYHSNYNSASLPARCTISVQNYINVYKCVVYSGMPSPTRTPSPTPTPTPTVSPEEIAASDSAAAASDSAAAMSSQSAPSSSAAEPSQSAETSAEAAPSPAAPSSEAAPESQAAPSADPPAPPSPAAPSAEEDPGTGE